MNGWPDQLLRSVLCHAHRVGLKDRLVELRTGDYYDLEYGHDRVRAQIHILQQEPRNLALVIGYADAGCPEPSLLTQIQLGEEATDPRVLSGDYYANWLWLRALKVYRHLQYPARVFRVPAEMVEGSYPRWHEIDSLLKYAAAR